MAQLHALPRCVCKPKEFTNLATCVYYRIFFLALTQPDTTQLGQSVLPSFELVRETLAQINLVLLKLHSNTYKFCKWCQPLVYVVGSMKTELRSIN